MKKLLFCFSLICCIVPMTVTAADLFNTSDSFKVAKAVKLGRGKAYSVATVPGVNTGSGGTKIKECPENCAECNDSTKAEHALSLSLLALSSALLGTVTPSWEVPP